MVRYPYRVEDEPPDASPDASLGSARFEERCLAVVLLVAGLIGLVLGLTAPSTHGTELVLGSALATLGLWTLRPRRARTERTRARPN